jgi:hypothetical protein
MSTPQTAPKLTSRSTGKTLAERKHLAFAQRSEYINWFHSLDLASMKRLHKAWNKAAGGKP